MVVVELCIKLLLGRIDICMKILIRVQDREVHLRNRSKIHHHSFKL